MATPAQPPSGRPVQPGAGDVLFDLGNPLLAMGVPARMVTGKIPSPAGELGVITIRTTTATMTVTADRKGISDWADLLAGLRDQMSDSGLVTVGVPSKLLPGRR